MSTCYQKLNQPKRVFKRNIFLAVKGKRIVNFYYLQYIAIRIEMQSNTLF
jgi:hypothetical protein